MINVNHHSQSGSFGTGGAVSKVGGVMGSVKTFLAYAWPFLFVGGGMFAMNSCSEHILMPAHRAECVEHRINGYRPIKCYDVNGPLDKIGFPFVQR
jgi:hypothetical protein